MAETAAGPPRSASEAAEARAYGLTAGDLRDWALFSPIEIYWAVKHDVAPAAAARWARAGLRACDTVRAIALGMAPGEVRPWAEAGFAPSDAVEAKEAGVALETAVAWRAAGFILPDAALLIRDGWTLREAVNARYAGIADEDWRPGAGPAGRLLLPGCPVTPRGTHCRAPRRPDNLTIMRDETIGSFLTRLAARSAAPGGGAAGALQAAQAAALLAMVARFSEGPRFDAETVGRVRAAADGLAEEGVVLAEADSAAFEKVIAAYGLPRGTPEAKAARSAAIADATAGAARPPADLMAASVRLVGLAEELLPVANKNVISDIAAAAAAISAAAVTAAVNIEANLSGIKDPALAEELSATAALADGVADRADRVIAAIREEIAQ